MARLFYNKPKYGVLGTPPSPGTHQVLRIVSARYVGLSVWLSGCLSYCCCCCCHRCCCVRRRVHLGCVRRRRATVVPSSYRDGHHLDHNLTAPGADGVSRERAAPGRSDGRRLVLARLQARRYGARTHETTHTLLCCALLTGVSVAQETTESARLRRLMAVQGFLLA